MLSRVFLSLCVVFFISITGCLPISDFGQYWENGFVEKGLEGTWVPDSNGMGGPAIKITPLETEA